MLKKGILISRICKDGFKKFKLFLKLGWGLPPERLVLGFAPALGWGQRYLDWTV